MSMWTHISGQVTVSPTGRSQNAKLFVLNEVLDRLPLVEGSEGPMTWHVVQCSGHDCSSSHDPFGERTDLGTDSYGCKSDRGWFRTQSRYVVVLEGHLRDTCYEETLRAFVKWMNRLAKRVSVDDMLVRVSGDSHHASPSGGWWSSKVFDGAGCWRDMCHDALMERIHEEPFERRLSANWRYGLVPDTPYWPERLHELLPFDERMTLDLVSGTCEPEEYLEWLADEHRHGGIDPDVAGMLGKFADAYAGVLEFADAQGRAGMETEEVETCSPTS